MIDTPDILPLRVRMLSADRLPPAAENSLVFAPGLPYGCQTTLLLLGASTTPVVNAQQPPQPCSEYHREIWMGGPGSRLLSVLINKREYRIWKSRNRDVVRR